MKRSTIPALVTALALAVPATASASSSTCQAYNPQTCAALSPTSHALPFTGLDLGLLGAGGAALILVGVATRISLRRATRPEPPEAEET